MGIILRRERRASPTFPEPIIPPFRGADVYGHTNVTSDGALGVPTVWACVALLANAVSMLPLETFKRSPSDIPTKLPSPSLLLNPYGDMTQSEWLHMLMVSLLLRGNAIGRIVARDGFQYPTQIQLLNPDSVAIKVDRDTGTLSYILTVDGKQEKIPNVDIWHVRGMTMPGSKVGLSPISYAAATLGVDLSSRQFAQDFFTGGGIPKAVIKSNQTVTQTQSRTLKDRLLAGARNREPIVLGDGLEYMPISVKPEESQFLLTQQANVAQVARYFSIPDVMVGGSGGGSMTYSSVEMLGTYFLTYSVSFWLKRIEDAMYSLRPGAQYVRFNTSALLRTDAETQAKVHVQLLAGKVLTPTEVRASYDLPPMTEDQKAEADMVPLTITPLGSAKGLPGLKLPPGPVAPTPANDQQGASNAPA